MYFYYLPIFIIINILTSGNFRSGIDPNTSRMLTKTMLRIVTLSLENVNNYFILF